MGILNSIKEKIFGKKAPAPAPAPMAPAGAFAAATAQAAAAKAAAAAQSQPVDVEAVVEALVKAKGKPSNWRVSIVDLLSALDLPNDLAARKELAKDLNYSGPHADGSAEKNMWLHAEVMKILAENGGKLPSDIKKN